MSAYILFSGSSHPSLAEEVAKFLGKPLGKRFIELFPDGETKVELQEDIRGKDVFILQTMAKDPDHFLVELLLMVDAAKREGAKKITAVVPYFAYARGDHRTEKKEPLSAKLMVSLLETAGVDQVVAIDLHSSQMEGFFSVPLIHLTTRPLFVDRIKKEWPKKNAVVVSPDIGRIEMAKTLAKELDASFGMVVKERESAKKVIAKALMGEVREKDVFLVDDILSTGETIRAASKLCREGGAKSVVALVVHGPLVTPLLEDDTIDKFFLTNTIAQNISYEVSVTGLLGKTICQLVDVGNSPSKKL